MNAFLKVVFSFLWLVFSISQITHAADPNFAATLSSSSRSDTDKMLDLSRKPEQVIDFLGIKQGSSVMDILSFGGWYAEVMSAAVGPEGRVIAQNSPRYLKTDLYKDVVKEVRDRASRLNNLELYFKNTRDLGVDGKIDSALIALRLRDAYIYGGEEVTMGLLEQIYNALKPGGIIGIIDYVGIADQDNKKLHRIEISTVRRLLANAGFEFEAQSDLLANSRDDHLSVVVSALDPSSSLKQNSERKDRMLIRARKPAK